MFDIGFSELLLIGIIALVVIGPERLPRVARTAGHLFGRLQRYVADVKADINREIHAEELRKLQDEMRASVNSLEQSVAKEMQQGDAALHGVKEQIHEIVEISGSSAGKTAAAPIEPVAAVVEESTPRPAKEPLSPPSGDNKA